MRGLVHLRQFLTPCEQRALVALAQRQPLAEHAFRRRYYGAIVPPLQALADRALAAASDPLLPRVDYTHYILLHYLPIHPPPEFYIPWHCDNGQNDGDADYPIVSFSVGDSCTLLVSPSKPRLVRGSPQAQALPYESGDAVIWGGPARGLWHAVKDVLPNSSPLPLPLPLVGRINFTLRCTPQLIGHEEQFREIPNSLPKRNRFYRLQ